MVQNHTCWHTQGAQCDLLNKGRSRWTGTSCIVLEVPLRNLLTSMCEFVPCGQIVQRAYSNIKRSNKSVEICRQYVEIRRKAGLKLAGGRLLTRLSEVCPTFFSFGFDSGFISLSSCSSSSTGRTRFLLPSVR